MLLAVFLIVCSTFPLLHGIRYTHVHVCIMTPTTWLFGKLKSAVILTYGLCGLLFYGLVAVKLGYFFKPTTEKEELELKIGTLILFFVYVLYCEVCGGASS